MLQFSSLLRIQIFTLRAFAGSLDIRHALINRRQTRPHGTAGNMHCYISFDGATEEETKNAAVSILIYDCDGKKADITLTKTEDKTVPGSPEGSGVYHRTCTFSGSVPLGENYTIRATVHMGDREESRSIPFDVCTMRRISGTIRLPDNETAANPIQCRILLLDREALAGDPVIRPLPTEICAVIPKGDNQTEYQYDYSCEAYRDPVIIDCRISGDNRYADDHCLRPGCRFPLLRHLVSGPRRRMDFRYRKDHVALKCEF